MTSELIDRPRGSDAATRRPDVRVRPSVLVVSPAFFGYESDIVDAFRAEGADAVFVDERPSNSSLMRAALRVGAPGLRGVVDRHFRAALESISRPIDLVVLIKGESTPRWFLERIRAEHPGVRIAYYSYDRIRDGDHCLDVIPACDAAYSFDPEDVAARGMSYKPLFHGPLFGPSANGERRYDVSFVGTAHSDRYAYATAIAAAVERAHLFFYSPARWFFALQKHFGRLRGVPWSAVSFEKLPKAEVADVFGRSRAVVDLQRDGQHGLTMRTFEVLASGARLITTNARARELPGVDPDAVLVVPFDEVAQRTEEIRAFVDRPVIARPVDDRYGLRAWVRGFLASVPADRLTSE